MTGNGSALHPVAGTRLATDNMADDTLALFIANAPAMLAMFDSQMRHIVVSQDWATFMGTRAPDLVCTSLCDVLPEIPEQWRTAYQRAQAGKVTESNEGQVVDCHGRTIWLRWRIRPVPTEAGGISAVIIYAEDITSQKLAEQKVHHDTQRLQLITGSLGAGTFERDLNTGETIISDTFLDLLQIDRAAMPSTMAGWIGLLRPKDLATYNEARQRALDPGGDGRCSCEVRPVVAGQERFMQMQARVVFQGNGRNRKPERMIGLLIDHTENHRLQEALFKSQRLETVGRLAGIITHDFNNILSVILSNLELAVLRIEDVGLRDLLKHAVEAAEMGAGVNKRLLALAGGHSGLARPVAIDEHLSRTWEIFRRVLSDEIDLRFDPGSAGAIVMIDAAELDGALLNLIMNARDAQPGGGQITVRTGQIEFDKVAATRIRGGRAGRFLSLCVADTGSGMEEAVARRAGEPFFTTKDRGRGSGLGLASVGMTAERAGGFVNIRSTLRVGTEVSIFLPLAEMPDAAPAPEDDEFPFGDGELILVVDDDDLVREAVMKRLEAIGYAVIEAASGAAALKLLEAGEPVVLVFSDVVMPGALSGYDLIREVRRLYPHMGVLLTSGHVSLNFRDRAGREPGVELLAKPYPLKLLADAVARAIRLVEFPA